MLVKEERWCGRNVSNALKRLSATCVTLTDIESKNLIVSWQIPGRKPIYKNSEGPFWIFHWRIWTLKSVNRSSNMWTLLPWIRNIRLLLFKQYLNWFIQVPWDTSVSFIDITDRKKWICTSRLWWPAPAEGTDEDCGASDSLEWRTLSSESMEEAELTEIPEAEVMEEREEWMNVHT